MANLKEHAYLGAGAGILTYAIMCRICERPFDFGEMLGCAAAATATALVPDIIEPALNPHHRSLAHSVTTGCGIARLAIGFCGAENRDSDDWHKILWAASTAGYLSHLLADGCTPRGLPLVA